MDKDDFLLIPSVLEGLPFKLVHHLSHTGIAIALIIVGLVAHEAGCSSLDGLHLVNEVLLVGIPHSPSIFHTGSNHASVGLFFDCGGGVFEVPPKESQNPICLLAHLVDVWAPVHFVADCDTKVYIGRSRLEIFPIHSVGVREFPSTR